MADNILKDIKYIFSYDLALLAILIIAMWLGKLINDLLIRRYKVDDELIGKNNPAVGITQAGYYVGLAVAIAGVVVGPGSGEILKDLSNTAIYSILAIILMNIATFINDKFILYKFDDQKELVDDRNVGTGAVLAGTYIATGFIISSSVSGEASGDWWHGLLSCLIFFILGQIVLIIAGIWYQFMVRYDVHKTIEDDNNAAAGISFGGFLFTVGYIASAAMAGEGRGVSSYFANMAGDIISFILYVVVAIIFLTIGYWITDFIFLPKAKMSDEVGKQGNIAASAISVAINIGIAVLIVHVL